MEKGRKFKLVIILAIIVVVIGLSIAFAAMSGALNIKGTGKVDPANWDIHFVDLSNAQVMGNARIISEPTISNNGANISNLRVGLSLPGDEVIYTVDVENSGTVDSEIESLQLPEFTEEQSQIFEFKAEYTSEDENGNKEIKVGDRLSPGQKKNVTLTIRYKDIEDPDLLPQQQQELNITFKIIYTQKMEYAEGEEPPEVITDTVWNFDYNGTDGTDGEEQTFTVPYTGYYKLETWGAQGGTGLRNGALSSHGGYGGYSTGVVYLEKDQVLYINVGGRGKDGVVRVNMTEGGYNGGGDGRWDNSDNEVSGAGGGATHIATTSGLLSNLESNKNNILIVSGSGGGSTWTYAGGNGGGISGTNGENYDNNTNPGTQSTGYAFGEGGVGAPHTGTPGAGGGAGYYGGFGGLNNGRDAVAGAGGSGYIGNTNLVSTTELNKHMTCYNCTTSNRYATKTTTTTNVSAEATSDYAKENNGYARITWIAKQVEISAPNYNADELPGDITNEGDYTGAEDDPYTVLSIEDLVAFSQAVDNGTNYSGKYITLGRNLDFNDTSSYENYKTTEYGDINENGEVEELKTELTTGKGFNPVGDNSHRFSGTFDGNNNTISNLYINRSQEDYVGFFGYVTGSVKALNINNSSVTGNNFVGTLSGQTQSNINNINATGEVKGKSNTGGLIGYSWNVDGLVFEGDVEGTQYVGGVVGRPGEDCTVRGIYKSGNVTGTSNVSRILGQSRWGVTSIGYSTSEATVNGNGITEENPYTLNGRTIDDISKVYKDINMAEAIYDTYIAGDEDTDGYYWDYDENFNVILKKTSEYPLTFNLTGSGTDADPYLINNYEDLKQASMKPSSSFKLNADIDLNNKHYYMLSSYRNRFSGTFDGNMHTISNLTLDNGNISYYGMFGYVTGSVKALNINNSIVYGLDFVGTLSGQTQSNINNINATGEVKGKSNTGGLIGYSWNVDGLVFEGDVEGTQYVGGVVGRPGEDCTVRGIYKSGNVTGTSNVSRILGQSRWGVTSIGYSTSEATVNGNGITEENPYTLNGRTIDDISKVYKDINMAEAIYDTYIAGDEDTDGYYWDYDENFNVILKKTSEYPLTFNLTGSGTDADPYLINNYEDLKQASMKPSSSFKLNADIDLNNKHYYMLSSYRNRFSGTFDGNMHTIRNLTLNSNETSYLGLFGYVTGTIINLTVDNMNITGDYNVGIINGYGGTIKHNNVSGIVNGYNNVGGIAGHNSNLYSNTANVDVTGNTYVGGAVGYNEEGYKVGGTITEGDITGVTGVGGIIGRSYCYACSNVVQGVYKSGNVKGNSNVNRISGQGGAITGLAAEGTSVNGVEINEKDATTLNGQTIETYEEIYDDINLAEMVLDTYLGGDNDTDGYYLDYDSNYKVVEKSVETNPLTFNLTGSGTDADPYLINNYSELKQVGLQLNKIYRLNADLDLNGVHHYVIGSRTQTFSGTFDGYGHTISNLNLPNQNVSYYGFFGNSSGTIKNLMVNNANVNGNFRVGIINGYGGTIKHNNVSGIVTGYNNVGGIAGHNSNSYSNTANVDVTGNTYVGGAVGYNEEGYKVGGTITEGDITGVTGVGGIIGRSYCYACSNVVQGVYKSGNVKGNSNVNRISGQGGAITGLAAEGTSVNGVEINEKDATTLNGQTIETYEEIYDDINLAEMVLDTYLGGDNDTDGYYLDYDSNYKVVEKSVETNPLTFNLTGSGTDADPYLINNYSELKQVGLQLNKIYRLNADLDLNGVHHYVIGSRTQTFSGTFDGYGHTISNLNLPNQNVSYYGFFGNSSGTIKNLMINDMNAKGNNYVGSLVGNQTGTMTNIKVSNSSAEGTNYVGTLAGYGNTMNQVIVSGNVTGVRYVGGIAGRGNTSKGVYLKGNVVGTSDTNRIYGTSSGTKNVLAVKDDVTVNGNTVTGTNQNSNIGLDVTISDLTQSKYEELGFVFTATSGNPYWELNNGIMNIKIAE